MAHNWHTLEPTRADLPPTVVPVEATRSKWTDERMDEFAQRTEESFKDARSELKSEIGGLRGEMNARFARLEDKIDRRFDILFGALATGFVAAVVQHFIG
jgi:hypothetical protein